MQSGRRSGRGRPRSGLSASRSPTARTAVSRLPTPRCRGRASNRRCDRDLRPLVVRNSGSGSFGRVRSPHDRRPHALCHLIAGEIAVSVRLFLGGQNRCQKLGTGLFVAPQQGHRGRRDAVADCSPPDATWPVLIVADFQTGTPWASTRPLESFKSRSSSVPGAWSCGSCTGRGSWGRCWWVWPNRRTGTIRTSRTRRWCARQAFSRASPFVRLTFAIPPKSEHGRARAEANCHLIEKTSACDFSLKRQYRSVPTLFSVQAAT